MPVVTTPSFDAVHWDEEAAICNRALSRIGCELIRDSDEQTSQARLCRAAYDSARQDLLRAFPFRFSTRSAYINDDDDYELPFSDYTYAYKAENWDTFSGSANIAATISGITGITVNSTLIDMEVSGTDVPEGARIIAVDTTEGAETITLDRATTGAVTDFSIHIPMLRLLYAAADRYVPFMVAGSGADKRILCDEQTGTNDSDGLGYLEVLYTHDIKDPDRFDPMFADALVAMVASRVVFALTKSVQAKQIADQEFSALFNAAKMASSEEMQIDAEPSWWSDLHGIGSDVYPGRTV
jgi:hypothetical protein